MTVLLSPNLAGIRCFACETCHDPQQLLTVCRACGLPLRVDYNLSSLKLSLRDLQSREPSLRRYRELLPLLPGDEVIQYGQRLEIPLSVASLREEALQPARAAY